MTHASQSKAGTAAAFTQTRLLGRSGSGTERPERFVLESWQPSSGSIRARRPRDPITSECQIP